MNKSSPPALVRLSDGLGAGGRELTVALAKALGLPKNTVRAVLTLDATEEHPRLELVMHATDGEGRPIVEEVPGEYGEGVEHRLAKVQFMVRLERFPDASGHDGGT